MGYLTNDHIKAFVRGQSIVRLETEDTNVFRLRFQSGESLQLFVRADGCKCCAAEVIATPYDANGEVRQSLAIKAELAQGEKS